MAADSPESRLVRRAQSGDTGAFEKLVEHYGGLVLGLARRVLAHREDAGDVAQEVFLRLYRSLDRVDPDRPFEAWVVRITLNAARSHGARRPGRREAELGEAREPAAPDPRTETRADLQRALRASLSALSPRERDVFLLRDVQGLETEIVAEALGISPVTVRRQSGEARRKVARWIEQHFPELVRD